ncbi:endopolygalacturonase [Seiridium cupressi]
MATLCASREGLSTRGVSPRRKDKQFDIPAAGDTGIVTDVTYDDITLSSISKYGILIEQNYDGGDLDGTATTGVPITDLTIKNLGGTGAVSSSGYDVVVVCGSSSSCSSWTWSNVTVTGGKTYGSCQNAPSVTKCS